MILGITTANTYMKYGFVFDAGEQIIAVDASLWGKGMFLVTATDGVNSGIIKPLFSMKASISTFGERASGKVYCAVSSPMFRLWYS